MPGLMRAAAAVVVAASLLGVVGCGSPAGGAPVAGGARGPSKAPEGALTINIALPIEELDLPNGLHVVLHQERSSALSLVYVRYHVGSKDDPPGRSGFAHIFEHLMFRGSRNTGAKDYQQWLEDVGGITNASTDLDETDYHAYVPPGALPRAIWLEADRMAYPLAPLDDAGFAHERDVVKNEWRQHYEDVPFGNLDAIAREAVYGAAHPYGSATIGRGDEIDKTTLEEARAFARVYYRPNNATLVIAGVFDSVATRALVTRYFATIPAGPAPPARSLAPAKPTASQRIDVAAAVDGPAVMIAWPAPATHGDGMEELAYGLSFFSGRVRRRLITEKKIANEVDVHYEHARLGGLASVVVKLKPGESPDTTISVIDEYLAEASRLNVTVRKELGASYGVHMSAVGLRAGGIVTIAAAIDTARTVEALRGLFKELDRLRTEALTAAELGAAKLRTYHELERGSTRGLARYLAHAIAEDLPHAYVVTHNARVDVVTAEAVRAAAARYLGADDAHVVIVGDASSLVAGLKTLGIGDVSLAAPR
jgi:zinc protease